MDEFEMREAEREGRDRIAADNAEIGAAALRRVDALEAMVRKLIEPCGLLNDVETRMAARKLLDAEWMPERSLSAVA